MSMSNTEEQVVQGEEKKVGGYLTFTLGSEEFGIDIGDVIEIIGVQPITHLPEVPHYIKGIINLRGRVVPVIDMRLKFGKESAEYDDRTCVIVIEINALTVGLIVDRVSEVTAIANDQIVAPPEQGSMGTQNQYISGIGKVGDTIILLLDCDKLLQEDTAMEENRDL